MEITNKKKILIFTSSIDSTVDYIMDKYSYKAEFYRVNVDLFQNYSICINGNNQWYIECKNWDKTVCKSDINSIYYRKPMLPNLTTFESECRPMISRDIIATIDGIVDCFEKNVLTKPFILRKCENKIYQLLYALDKKFLIPKSYIGNSNNDASKFLKFKSIIKPLTTGKIYYESQCEIFQTNYFDTLDKDISLTPIYLQEYQEKSYEVRITFINKKFYAVKIETTNLLDWRKEKDNKYSLAQVPYEIVEKCNKLMTDFELIFGAFDFIVSKDNNKWVFLEVNPNGQWLWLEQALDLNISDDIVNYLLQ